MTFSWPSVVIATNMEWGSPELEAGNVDWPTNKSTLVMTQTNWNIPCFSNNFMCWMSFILKHIHSLHASNVILMLEVTLKSEKKYTLLMSFFFKITLCRALPHYVSCEIATCPGHMPYTSTQNWPFWMDISGKNRRVLHGRGGDKQHCLTEQQRGMLRAHLLQSKHMVTGGGVPDSGSAGSLGGAAILLMSAVRLGGAAIREGAANRDNTVLNTDIWHTHIQWNSYLRRSGLSQ